MHSVEFLSIYGLRAGPNEHIWNIKGPLNASVGGGFWRVEALKTAKPEPSPSSSGWFVKHHHQEAIAEPRCLRWRRSWGSFGITSDWHLCRGNVVLLGQADLS